MRKTAILYTFAMLAVLPACQRAEEPTVEECPAEMTEEPVAGTSPIPTGFRASLPGPVTKTAADMTTGTVTWLTDDPILVSNGYDRMTMYVTEGGSTQAELYALDEVFDGNAFYAVYPAENAAYSAGIFQSAIPSVQHYVPGGFATQTFPMVSIADSRRNFAFRNAASLLMIEASSQLFEGVRISAVSVTADEALSGAISVNYTPGSDPVVDCGGGEKQVTVLGPDEGIPFGEPVYVVVAPGDYTNLHVRLTLSNGLNYVYAYDEKVSVNRSAYRKLNVVVEDNYEDLSAEESANCYMLTRGGSYKFRAGVKGNGVETSCGLPALTEGAADVKVYYTDGSAFVDGGFALAGDYIYFSTVDGNLPTGTALVSAVDEDGVTLWSWHIWANSAIEDVTLSNGSVWLNMNLGAHQVGFNPNGYNGYYYQWGRKDPFLQKHTTSTAAGTLAPFVSHASAIDGSLANSIANPHIFYGGYHPSGVSNITEDWSTYDDEEKVYDWWNRNSTGDGQNDVEAAKTMFDPCPPGYHVPVYSDLNALLAMAAADVQSSSEGRTVEGKLFFPYTSYRYIAVYADWWPGGKEASRIFIPSATPYETTTKFHRRYSRMYMTSSPSQGLTNGIRSYAVPVRCIKDGTSEPGGEMDGEMDGTIEDFVPDDWD